MKAGKQEASAHSSQVYASSKLFINSIILKFFLYVSIFHVSLLIVVVDGGDTPSLLQIKPETSQLLAKFEHILPTKIPGRSFLCGRGDVKGHGKVVGKGLHVTHFLFNRMEPFEGDVTAR